MKLTRIPCFNTAFGRLEFFPAQPGHKIFWQPAGKTDYRRVHWTLEPPTPKLARFFIRKAVAEDRGLPPHTFTDANIDPPESK
jgi:hypothetical protein